MFHYNLGRYRWNYRDGKIYKQIWWFIYRCVDNTSCKYLAGVRKVNKLCGIKEE